MKNNSRKLDSNEIAELLAVLSDRFHNNMQRHADLKWDDVRKRLEAQPDKLVVLAEMERTEGEPDVVDFDAATESYIFYDCSVESPKGRRSLCYDRKALDARKANKPENSALDLAEEIGIRMLTEEEYKRLQQLGQFDLKTSSWVSTPDAIRKLGGAIFCDRRYDQVFTYHNGADSYYSARGFRGAINI